MSNRRRWIVAGLVVGAAGAAIVVWRYRQRQPEGPEEVCALCAIDDPLTGGPRLVGRHIHEVIHRPNDDLESELRQGGGGTFTAQTYCAAHCPGGCANPKCRRMVA